MEGYPPAKLSSDISTALRQLKGELDKMDDRIRFGTELRKALERFSGLSAGEQKDALENNRELKVRTARWNVGL